MSTFPRVGSRDEDVEGKHFEGWIRDMEIESSVRLQLIDERRS